MDRQQPRSPAVRGLADNAKSPDQQQVEADQARQLEIKRMIDELRNVDIEGFFPTPDPVIDMMLAAADMHDGQTVLEPSAGIGSICDRVKQAFPHVDLDAVELRDPLAKILVAKGHAVVGRDFPWNGNGRQYDRVLMNPPFEKGVDMAHVRQAFNHVKPGGRLVAIMSNGFRFRQTTGPSASAAGWKKWTGTRWTCRRMPSTAPTPSAEPASRRSWSRSRNPAGKVPVPPALRGEG